MSEVIYGRRPVSEALASDPGGAVELVVARGSRKGLGQIMDAAKAAGVSVREAAPETLNRLSSRGNHQGVVLRIQGFEYDNFRIQVELWSGMISGGSEPLVVVCDQVQDTGNLGAVLRTAAGLGAVGVVLPERRSAGVTPAAVRASAGMARKVSVSRVTNLSRALETLKAAGFWVAGAGAEGGRAPWSVELTGPLVLVMGSEGKGMRRLVRESCDHVLTVPLVEGVESVNVSAAAAMLLYEVARQRSGAQESAEKALDPA